MTRPAPFQRATPEVLREVLRAQDAQVRIRVVFLVVLRVLEYLESRVQFVVYLRMLKAALDHLWRTIL